MNFIKVKGGIRLVFDCGDVPCNLCKFLLEKSCKGLPYYFIKSKLIKPLRKAGKKI